MQVLPLTIDSFSSFPRALNSKIIDYLDFNSLLQLEGVSKNFSSLYPYSLISTHTWKVLKLRDGFNYSWKVCENEINPEKWEYRLIRALYQYMIVHKYHKKTGIGFAEIIRFKYLDLRLKYPILRSFIGIDLFKLYKSTNRYLFHVRKKDRENFMKMCSFGHPGESLLRGLLLTRTLQFSDPDISLIVQNIFYKTMGPSATLASLFALELANPYSKFEDMLVTLCLRATKYSDCRALTKLMEEL